jgi:hypothetical protein
MVLFEYTDLKWSVQRDLPSMWRYWRMLPPTEKRVTLGEGYTPIKKVGGVFVKNETTNPTRSYADRASSTIVSNLDGTSLKYVKDFALSLTYYLKSSNKPARVYVDQKEADPQELIFLHHLGAEILFQDAPSLSVLNYDNPFTVEGLKTIAFEIVERLPKIEEIYVPAKSGLLALSIIKGLREASEMGVDSASSYSVVAVRLGGNEELPHGIRTMNADPREALKSLVDLARVGIRTELLSASAYSMAANSGSGLALLTGSSRIDIRLGRGRCSPIKSDVKRALERRGSATAYEIWEDLGTYSLRGIYKIMRAMEIEGTVKGEYFMRGRRRVKRYRLL